MSKLITRKQAQKILNKKYASSVFYLLGPAKTKIVNGKNYNLYDLDEVLATKKKIKKRKQEEKQLNS